MQHAEQLFGIDIQFKINGDEIFELDTAFRFQIKRFLHIKNDGAQLYAARGRRGLLRAAIGHNAFGVIDGTAQRVNKLWRETLHHRVLGVGQPV
ncbi:hypothetical protein FQZ97_960330 [compost metagenome]